VPFRRAVMTSSVMSAMVSSPSVDVY
jgi:hypothetical protein